MCKIFQKSSQSPAASSPGSKKLAQVPPGMVAVGGFYQQSMNMMTPSPHGNVAVDYAGNKRMFITPNATASPLAATENTFGQTRITHESSKIETRFLPQPTSTPTPPPPPRGPFIDPLESYPKSFDGKYHGHDPGENGWFLKVALRSKYHVVFNISFKNESPSPQP